MSRIGLMAALAIAAIAGCVFAIAPALDLRAASLFRMADGGWIGAAQGSAWPLLRTLASWIVAAVAAPAAAALALRWFWPGSRWLMPLRSALFLLGTLALAPGIVTNVILKDHWGRPRPVQVSELGGHSQFRAWWDPRGDCIKNCSFVAGEPSGAFWTLAPAALAPAPWRPLAYGAALVFGASVGVLRMAAGGHFLSDVIFAGVFTFLVIWTVHGLLFRWPAARAFERRIRAAWPPRRAS